MSHADSPKNEAVDCCVVAVIIPFFQRSPGLLRSAVESVVGQDFRGIVNIIVVDDESPVSPDQEIYDLARQNRTIKILRQKNSGPGVARNLGLDNVESGTTHVAFLDSDDTWYASHISNALSALVSGFSFYFSNHLEPGSNIDEFSQRGFLKSELHEKLPGYSHNYKFVGSMIDQIICANIIETSTVVYDWRNLAGIRFDARFRNAFEDHLFWLEAASAAKEITFSTAVEVKYGVGVSIWRSSRLGDPGQMRRISDHLRFLKYSGERFARTSRAKAALGLHVDDLRLTLTREILHSVRRSQRMDTKSLFNFLCEDPWMFFQFFFCIFKVMGEKL
jgi:succinoglycan biosynthesis protein ExoW